MWFFSGLPAPVTTVRPVSAAMSRQDCSIAGEGAERKQLAADPDRAHDEARTPAAPRGLVRGVARISVTKPP